MKKLLITLFSLLLFSQGFSQPSNSEQGISLSLEQREWIDKKAEELPNQAQLAVAIIHEGEVGFYGVKRQADSTVIVSNADSVFEIGSITKVFTSTLLSSLALEERLELEIPINEFLPFDIKDSVRFTFAQLATHTSGLPRIPASLMFASLDNPYKDYDEERLETYLQTELHMQNEPGKASEYSNLGAAVLGYVLEKIDQRSYEDMLQGLIFSRYRMSNSTTDRALINEKLVKGINDAGEEVPNWDMAAFVGAGGILSTVSDLSKFALAQFDTAETALALTRKPFFTINDNYSMGLGWSVIQTESGDTWNWHNGGTGGYTSSMIIDVKKRNGVIVLSNITALGSLSPLASGLAPELMGTFE